MEQLTDPSQCQVFINHCGKDTKKNIASLVYHTLTSYGLRVFLDQEELSLGDTLDRRIPAAIRSASVLIAIFSVNYAKSKWCLKELVWMLRSSPDPKVIIPIFCDVEPADLKHIDNGCYAEDFKEYRCKGKVPKKMLKKWEKALKEASNIVGQPFKMEGSDYGQFLKKIEDMVIKNVKWDSEVPAHAVGLDQALNDFEVQLQTQSSTKVLGLAGVCGIGKSTLAKHYIDSRRSNFSRAAYLSDVRKTDLTSLQRELLRCFTGKVMEIRNTHIGKNILRNILKGLKVLIVLDDVDDRDTVKSVLDLNAVAPGSLILITSRDKDVLRFSSANTFLYEVKPLKRNHARQLFCRHAFHQPNPLEGYEDSVESFLKICEGVPLCLEDLGKEVACKPDRAYWEQQLQRYSQGLPLTEAKNVNEKLGWSFKALNIPQQQMLLDVGCFFEGAARELAVRVFGALGYYNNVENCLESLQQKSLVHFNGNVKSQNDIAITGGRHLRSLAASPQRGSTIIMPNHVRELALQISREDLLTGNKQLRLSCLIDIDKMLQLQSGSVCCRGICIRKERSIPQHPYDIKITGVRILLVENPIDSSWFYDLHISGDLVWLRWRNSHFISLPRTISLRNLRVLELQAPKEELLEEFFNSIDEVPSQLIELHIDASEEGPSLGTSSSAQPVDLQHSTNSLDGSISTAGQGGMPSFSRFLQSIGSSMKNLNKIVLKNVTVLQSLPFDCSELKSLRHLDLSGSTNLTTLPNSFSQLLQLQHLALRDCRNLSIPEHILGEISTLEHIDFKGCTQLLHLPHGITSQRRLRYLNLLETGLLELPSNLEPLDELEQLIIGSDILRELPCSVASLRNLKELLLLGCLELEHISIPIERLTRLERLEIYGSNLPILPAGITLLKHLKFLTIHSCPIENFTLDNNVMDALTDLTLFDTSISNISIPHGACPRLEIVDLSNNRKLRQVQVFQSTLVKLILDGCSSLECLRLPTPLNLKILNIKGCGHVRTPPNVENWGSLEEITAEKCCNLCMIEEACSQLERLSFLSFSRQFFRAGLIGSIDRAERVMEFDKFMRKSFRDVTMLEVPTTATPKSPLLLKNVHSHCAILMCFLTTDNGTNFKVNFEAGNSGAQSELFETASGDGGGGLVLHMYMWTRDSKLFNDEDYLYDKVSIYREGKFYAEAGERGWILTFASENRVLNACKQIIIKNRERKRPLCMFQYSRRYKRKAWNGIPWPTSMKYN